mgnify:CR=1 FL=1
MQLGNQKPAEVRDQSILSGNLSQIETRINSLFDASHRIEVAITRLFNPRPEDAAKGAESPPAPNTVEARLQNISRQLDSLHKSINDHADTLDRGV